VKTAIVSFESRAEVVECDQAARTVESSHVDVKFDVLLVFWLGQLDVG